MNVDLAAPWLEMAHGDLDVARILTDASEVRHSFICFHAQQAAEKAMKALLAAHGLDIPRTHDLARLLVLLPALGPNLAVEADILTPYAVASRYPDDEVEYDECNAAEAVEAADRICSAVDTALGLGSTG